jgi:hypothetical protein
MALVVEGSKLYCYNTEGDRNSVVRQALCKIDVTWLEERTVDTMGEYFEGLWVRVRYF